MAKPAQPALARANTVQMEAHAAASLSYIRATMEAAASLAVPGSAGIAMGTVGVMAAALSNSPRHHARWLEIWLIAAVVAGCVGGILLARRSSLRGLALSNTPLHRFTLCLVPPLLVGAVLTAVDWIHGHEQVIPATWLMLYGCALVTASAVTTRTVGLLGGLFMLFGLLALALPESWQMLMLGAGFGALHIVFGVLIGRRGHGHQIQRI